MVPVLTYSNETLSVVCINSVLPTGMLHVGTYEENVKIYVNLDLPTGPLDRLVRDWHTSGDMSEATSTWLCFQGR